MPLRGKEEKQKKKQEPRTGEASSKFSGKTEGGPAINREYHLITLGRQDEEGALTIRGRERKRTEEGNSNVFRGREWKNIDIIEFDNQHKKCFKGELNLFLSGQERGVDSSVRRPLELEAKGGRILQIVSATQVHKRSSGRRACRTYKNNVERLHEGKKRRDHGVR